MTSLVAISDEPAIDPNAPRRRVTLPVELPAFVSAEGVGLRSVKGVALKVDIAAMDARFRAQADAPESSLMEDEVHVADEGIAPSLFRRILGRAKTSLSVRTRVLAVEGKVLTVELETPYDGFLWPEGDVEVTLGGRELGTGTFDMKGSSRPGPYAKGLLIRVTLVGVTKWRCGVGDEVWVIGMISA